jgi:DNA-binding winged helix-turn-helix (wHTH) protein
MNNDIKEGYFGKELLNRYIINETVEFHPAAGTLRDVTRQHSEVTLNSPAARCLLLLITKAGGIVSQQEFMDIVWQKNGMNVTPNAYYQNISVLRKGLEKIGLNKEIVVTIPRIGVTLTSDVSIQKITPKVDTVLPVENAEIPIKPVGRLSEKCDVNNPAHPPGTAEEHMERSDEEALVSFKKSTGRYSIIFCFLMAASLILITELYSAKKKSNRLFF